MLVVALAGTMVVPMGVDFYFANGHGPAFALSALVTAMIGGTLSLACANADRSSLTIQQTFFLTTAVWVVLPLFGALPFILGAPNARIVDAYFESMSGLTTTGSTVFVGLQDMPKGILLWRGMLQWIGGVGVIVMAMVFLPALRVGGMQMFKTEAFDTMGKILPRAAEISKSISGIYVFLTFLCMMAYTLAGMNFFDALVYSMTTIATGGYANYDSSFGDMSPAAEYVAVFFMMIACMPFVRFVQLANGSARPLFKDTQVRGFVATAIISALVLAAWVNFFVINSSELAFRKAIFNAVSVMTGTGYASTDYGLWGSFPVALLFMLGLVGGCAGSATCAIKIFRFQILFASIKTQIQRIHSPSGIFQPRYGHRTIEREVISSVMSFFVLFMISLAVLSVALGMTGLDMITSITGAATALANVGPGFGSEIGPSGTFININDTAKWLLSLGMLLGRLELMTVYVLFTASFWRP